MPASSSSIRLRAALADALPERPFELRFWDGGVVEPTAAGAPVLEFRSSRAIGHLLRSPGQLGLGRAYVTGDIDVPDLDGVIKLLGRWRAPRLGASQKRRIALAALCLNGLVRPPAPPAAELSPSGSRHSRERDAEGIRHHYDVSNEFFALFLDESMTYSCALWRDGATTLWDAQRAKLELICSKLALKDGDRLLDIGCGWGSLAIRAASEHGASVVGITLSPSQAELARARVREAGVGDRVQIRVMDYRDLGTESFDAATSIGMVEHVGEEHIDAYAEHVARSLVPGARFLNHGITWIPPEPQPPASAFSDRYVFPDGQILHPSRMVRAFERAGLRTAHVEELHGDYAKTLTHWAERLDARLDEAIAIAGEGRTRVWRLYLRAARNGFDVGNTTVHQILCERRLPGK